MSSDTETIDKAQILVEAGGDSVAALVVRLALSVKTLHFEQRMVSNHTLPSGVRIQYGNVVATGAFAALEFLEDAFPNPPLLSEDPTRRARARRMVEVASPTFAVSFPTHARASQPPADSPERQTLCATLEALEEELEGAAAPDQPKSAFAVGATLSIGGLCVVAICFVARAHGISIDKYPNAYRVFSGLGKLPALTRIGLLHGRPMRLVDDLRPELRDRILSLMLERVQPLAENVRLLNIIAWPRSLEEKFFADGANKLPEPTYDIDRNTLEKGAQELEQILPKLQGDHVFLAFMHRMTETFLNAHRLILALGTPSFYQLSLEIYGGARTTAFDKDSTNYDLAKHIMERVGKSPELVDTRAFDTDGLIQYLEKRLARRASGIEIKVVRDPNLSAKVIAGTTRVRVREGAHFGRLEAEGLFLHEIETHALTAQNGRAHPKFPLLAAGGPRTTRTQEGLAVFSELMGRALSTPRLMRLAKRVELVAMAEDGASFLDLYRHLLSEGANERDAYLDVQRICRGGMVTGGAPFTKDACYLAGLVDIYDFMQRALVLRTPLLGELLVSGRLALEDMIALLWMRGQGIIEKPKLSPTWATEWDGLLSYFSFTSFLDEIDQDMRPQLPEDIQEFIRRSIAEIESREGAVAAQ
jgi:uncharacterized protein (TIGR02421 family)